MCGLSVASMDKSFDGMHEKYDFDFDFDDRNISTAYTRRINTSVGYTMALHVPIFANTIFCTTRS